MLKNHLKIVRKIGRGRPSIYTDNLADQICLCIAAGNSVRKICMSNDMPNEETIYRWVLNKPQFSKKYREAREIQQERYLDELIEIADDPSFLTGRHSTDSISVQHAKLRIDTRKWAMARLAPKKYGNKLAKSHDMQPENPLARLLQRIAGNSLPVVKNDQENDE